MASPDSWLVQTDFGTVLGPMPADVLAEMVRAQELLPTDLVRASTQEDWQLASEIPDLFPTRCLTDSEVGIVEAATISESADNTGTECIVPVDFSVIATVADQRKESARSLSPAPSHAAPSKTRASTRQKTSPDFSSWLRSPPHWPKAIALVVVLLAAWWLWPHSQRNIHQRIVAIWDELLIRRNDLHDAAGWDQFLVRANAELDEIVPWLEQHASPQDRELQLLLFASRDSLRAMLKNPKAKELPQQQRLLVLFQALEEFQNRSRLAQATTPADQNQNDSAKTLDPENGDSHLIIDPSLRK